MMINPKLKKIIFNFLDDRFNELEIKRGHGDWFGFYDENNKLVVGHSDDLDAWYYDGGLWTVHSEAESFNLEPKEYKEIIKEYIKLKYGFYVRSLI